MLADAGQAIPLYQEDGRAWRPATSIGRTPFEMRSRRELRLNFSAAGIKPTVKRTGLASRVIKPRQKIRAVARRDAWEFYGRLCSFSTEAFASPDRSLAVKI
jgi:hypothetical protein